MMRALALLLVLGCGGVDATTDDAGSPTPVCAFIESGPCHDGWSTLRFMKCDPGATPDGPGCVQDDYYASPYWCCP